MTFHETLNNPTQQENIYLAALAGLLSLFSIKRINTMQQLAKPAAFRASTISATTPFLLKKCRKTRGFKEDMQ